MSVRLTRVVKQAFDIRLWIALPASIAIIVALVGVAAGLNAVDAPYGWSEPILLLAGALAWTAAAYFLVRCIRGLLRLEARVDRFLEGRGWTPWILWQIARFAALLLLTFVLFYLPLNGGSVRTLYEELLGFDLRAFPALFVLAGVLCAALIRLRDGKFGGLHAATVRQVAAVSACMVLLLFAWGGHSLVSRFIPVFWSFGADLPGPTLLVMNTYEYWSILPLLAALLAVCVFLAGARMAGIGRVAFTSLIGMTTVATFALPVFLLAMFLPMATCSALNFRETGLTRLHAAAFLGHTDSALRLIARGENVNAQDYKGDTPLHEAVGARKPDIVHALLARGADVNRRNDDNVAPLHRAVARSDNSTDLLELLLAHGALVDTATNSGQTPLHYAARNGYAKAAALLLANGADVNARSKEGTPLDLAYAFGKKESAVVDLLVSHGAARSSKAELNETRRMFEQKELVARAKLVQQAEPRGCGV